MTKFRRKKIVESSSAFLSLHFWLMFRFLFLCLALLSWSARAMAQDRGSRSDSSQASAAPASTAKADYILQPGDLIRVQVFQEEDINKQGEVRVSQESTIALPLIGNIDLKNKTARQAEELIRRLYDADYLVNPQVGLIVLEYAPRRVVVSGSVTTPGEIFFPKEEGMTLLGAISRAGDFNRLADKKRVILRRTMADGEIKTFQVNVDELMKSENTKDTWPLQPGDVITVPERIL